MKKSEYFAMLLRKAADALSPELQRAKNVDLVTLPKGVSGTNCGNCRFLEKSGYCRHKEVRQQISDPPRMCCGEWDAEGTKRAWETKKAEMPATREQRIVPSRATAHKHQQSLDAEQNLNEESAARRLAGAVARSKVPPVDKKVQ